MKVFRVQVNDEVAARFDKASSRYGGREALLATLILDAAGAKPAEPPETCAAANVAFSRIALNAKDAASLTTEAAAMGLTRTAWITCLVRRRLHGALRFSRAGETALIAIHDELRRISLNLGQIARASASGVEDASASKDPAGDVGQLRNEIRRHVKALHAAFEGNLSYWEAGDERTSKRL